MGVLEDAADDRGRIVPTMANTVFSVGTTALGRPWLNLNISICGSSKIKSEKPENLVFHFKRFKYITHTVSHPDPPS